MYTLARRYALLSLLSLAACQGPDAPQPGNEVRVERIGNRGVVAWLQTDPAEAWWIEELQAPWPAQTGDRDLGPRRIVRQVAGSANEVLWEPADPDRLTAAVHHGQERWSAVGVDGERRPFLVRGEGRTVRARIVLDDPELAADPRSFLGSSAPDALRVGLLSEDSVRIGGSSEDLVVSLMTEHNAVLAYRLRWDGVGWQRGARTLVTPAVSVTPYLPDGASYDNFDAVVSPFHARLAVAPEGHAFVAVMLDSARMKQHNKIFGTQLSPLRRNGDPLYRPSDVLLTRIESDGSRTFAQLVGTPDVDDEIYAVAAGPAGSSAVVGRARRESGRDNTEWNVTVTTLDGEGRTTAAVLYDAADSGIGQSAAFGADGALWVGGSEGWMQNPSGISLSQDGRPFLLRLEARAGGPASLSSRSALLPRTSGHAELRALSVAGDTLWMGGLERAPLTHTGDADRSKIRADGFWSAVKLP